MKSLAVERTEAKSKGEKERYKHLNAEFQRIARRDKKAFSDQWKEIEEHNRMGKTRDLFKKIRYQGKSSWKDGLKKGTAQMKITNITGCFNWIVVKHRLTAMAKGDGHKIIMVVQYLLQLF